VPAVSTRKTERLLNLVICLLSTRRFISAGRIRDLVPGYETDSDAAFHRMFERDKEELRDLGIPLETGTNSLADDETGYRIPPRDYALPEIVLEPDEAAAVGLAAQVWRSAAMSRAASAAVLKLRAAGIETEPSRAGFEPRVDATEPAFDAMLAAVSAGRPVRFRYRTAGERVAEDRDVEPWGLVFWHGRWYLVGHDRDRRDSRVFRLSRVDGAVSGTGPDGTVQVPPGLHLARMVGEAQPGDSRSRARICVRADRAHDLRREAALSGDGGGSPGAASDATRAEGSDPSVQPGWDVLEVLFADPQRLAERLAGYGADVVVLDPPEARTAIIARLQALAGERPDRG